MKPYEHKILGFLNREKEMCERKLFNYDGDCNDMSHSLFLYYVERERFVDDLINYIQERRCRDGKAD